MLQGYINSVRDKLSLIKSESQRIARSNRKILDALAGIDNRENTIFGATVENIIDLISEYELRGGKHPMSSKSIKEAFRPDKVKIGDGWPLKVFSGKVQVRLYDILPLVGVATSYI